MFDVSETNVGRCVWRRVLLMCERGRSALSHIREEANPPIHPGIKS